MFRPSFYKRSSKLCAAAGWLLIFFTTVAVSVPFGMILQLGARLVLVTFYNGDIEDLPEWMKFIYTHVKAAAEHAQGLVNRVWPALLCDCATNSQASQTGFASFQSIVNQILL